jgi:LPXTG-site transpeptidase (sortase) family protein
MLRHKHKKTKKQSNELPGSRVQLRFSRHVLPVLAGLAIFVAVFGFFNSGIISGYVAYYFYSKHAEAQDIPDSIAKAYHVDPSAAPSLRINKINVTAPVLFDQTTVNEWAFLQALHNGVVHYPGTAVPGQPGNVVIFGHSSGQWWAPGHYKFIFTLLNKLAYGDKIYIDYQGTRYIYRVSNTKVVLPTDLSVLNQSSGHILTLMTCTPVGTSAKRLIVQAQQIVPKPPADTAANSPAAGPATANGQAALPGAQSFWEDLASLWQKIKQLF